MRGCVEYARPECGAKSSVDVFVTSGGIAVERERKERDRKDRGCVDMESVDILYERDLAGVACCDSRDQRLFG